ncbi:hypothetical protein BCR44DRAFT_184370 [Catenaria anguillulae PL171]|uniref:Uncharacterized protein n=1 Tax=Catenaria anguillulae PL171 TaxID=765915 RepID=A0A1Y2H430_9FUNG|nr:hypothetical protein BCR44DRAFT_184370 [Catenaria anguillulae PL171]
MQHGAENAMTMSNTIHMTAADLLPADLVEPILLLTHSPLHITTTCSLVATMAIAQCRPLRLAWLSRAISANKYFGGSGAQCSLDDSFGFFNRFLVRNPYVASRNPLSADFILWLLHAPRWASLPRTDFWVPILSHLLLTVGNANCTNDLQSLPGNPSDRAVSNLILVLRAPLMYFHLGRLVDFERVLVALCQMCPELARRPTMSPSEVEQPWCPGHMLDYGLMWPMSLWSPPTYVSWMDEVVKTTNVHATVVGKAEVVRARNVVRSITR